MSMKDNIQALLIVLAVLLLVFLFFKGVTGSIEKANVEEQQNQEFMKECNEEGGRLDTVGSVWTSMYIVCNPVD